jgi:metallo-beta-lactamase family protein
MKLTFIGADHEVTGSCNFIEAAGKKFLIDYGMEQGRNDFDNIEIPFPAGEIDFILVTHAHIDHTGLIPLLGARGFTGQVFATPATCDLCEIMLLDSAGIQEFEAEWRTRKGRRKGLEPFVPLYTSEDAEKVLRRFVECPYNRIIKIADGIKVRFTDVGHLLGSSSIELWITENGVEKKIVFSGDIGNVNQPLLKDPGTVDSADYVVIESTYGLRSHETRVDYVTELSGILKRTFDRGGNVVIPSFAVGRTQEMLYFFRQIKEQKLIQGYENFEVYVDSPLAVKATNIFNEHTSDCFDEEARELVEKGINPIGFPGLKLSVTSEESREINFVERPKVILSASGMCEAGRIKHHLKHNLWRKESTILFVGYQGEGTLGRKLLEGAKQVTLFGEEIVVEAEILELPGVSGHADREGLLKWAEGFNVVKPQMFFVVHGDDTVVQPFADLLHEKTGISTYAPYSGTVWDLLNNVCLEKTEGIPFIRRDEEGRVVESGASRASSAYRRLEDMAQRLFAVVRANRDGANKDLGKFADQIKALCDKWER